MIDDTPKIKDDYDNNKPLIVDPGKSICIFSDKTKRRTQ